MMAFQYLVKFDNFLAEFFHITGTFQVDHNKGRDVIARLAAADFSPIAFNNTIVFHFTDSF